MVTHDNKQIVFIVDDDEAVCDSIRELMLHLGLQVEAFTSALDFLQRFQPGIGGCLILDIRMAHMSGIELLHKLRGMGSQIPVVAISGHADVPMVIKVMKLGVVDFLQKPYNDQELLDSVNKALKIDHDQQRESDEQLDLERKLATLTERELDVMRQLVRHQRSKLVAQELQISSRTVDIHRQRIMKKLGVRSVSELLQRVGNRV